MPGKNIVKFLSFGITLYFHPDASFSLHTSFLLVSECYLDVFKHMILICESREYLLSCVQNSQLTMKWAWVFWEGKFYPKNVAESAFVLLRVVCTYFARFRLQTNIHGLQGSRKTENDLFYTILGCIRRCSCCSCLCLSCH